MKARYVDTVAPNDPRLRGIVERLLAEAAGGWEESDYGWCPDCGGVVERRGSAWRCKACGNKFPSNPSAQQPPPHRIGAHQKKGSKSRSRYDRHTKPHSSQRFKKSNTFEEGAAEVEALATSVFTDLLSYAALNELADEARHPRTGSPGLPPGDCDPVQHAALQARVDAICKGRSAWGSGLEYRCDRLTKCNQIKARAEFNKRCAAARWEVNERCFAGGNDTHRKEAFLAARRANACRQRFRDRRCTERGAPRRRRLPFE